MYSSELIKLIILAVRGKQAAEAIRSVSCELAGFSYKGCLGNITKYL